MQLLRQDFDLGVTDVHVIVSHGRLKSLKSCMHWHGLSSRKFETYHISQDKALIKVIKMTLSFKTHDC